MKNLKDVEIKALELIAKTYEINGKICNLQEKGFTFKFDNAKRRFGVMKIRSKQIQLSKTIVEMNLNNQEAIIDTILHEIAHALDYYIFGNLGHGRTWKYCARTIGAEPTRCFDSKEMNMKPYKYLKVCEECHAKSGYYKKPKIQGHCCKKCYDNKRIYNQLKLIKL